jgi:hypothetical protein
LQKIVRKLDIGLVDLVDQQNGPLVGGERLPQFAPLDVIAYVIDARIAQLAVAQPADGVTSSGRCKVMAAFTAMVRSSVAT